jgi:hypothetical protein
VTIPLAILDEDAEAYLEILHRPDRRLMAVVEVLSPANQIGADYVAYLAKRKTVLRQEVHLVELDLLVGGRRMPMRRPLPPADYYALVARGDRRPDCDVYSWSVRQALPTIRVPLVPTDHDSSCRSALCTPWRTSAGGMPGRLITRSPVPSRFRPKIVTGSNGKSGKRSAREWPESFKARLRAGR